MKKKKKQLWTGYLWMVPVLSAVFLYLYHHLEPEKAITPQTAGIVILLSVCVTIYLGIEAGARPGPSLPEKKKAMYPPVDKRMLFDHPEGVVFGKYHGKYVCRPLQEDGHIFLIGGSGSGKSSCLVIPTLLSNPNARIFAIDIKGELSFKSRKIGEENVVIFHPSDRDTFGYDPFFGLSKKSSSQQMVETMQQITFSLISLPAGLKDPFWKNSARNLLMGLLLYYYKAGMGDLVSIIDEILGKPVKESVKTVMENASPRSAEYRYIVQFSDMEDETLSGVFAELANHLVIFSNDQDIRYAFKDNFRKMHPHMLEEGYSIYLSIPEEKLSAYYDVLQIILNQTLAELEKRPEDSEPILFVMDEMPRIVSAGKLDRLLDGARTLRSRKVILFLVTQSTEALMSAYTENEVADLISNCPYIVVLSASSYKTQQSVIAWCGKYQEKRKSWSDSGKKKKLSISYEDKDIVDAAGLMTLPETGDAILISPFGYSRIRKTPYYKESGLKEKAEVVMRYNRTVQRVREETCKEKGTEEPEKQGPERVQDKD